MENVTVISVMLGLGAHHGHNPGMGWLFAVALGLQERRRSAVLRALGPIALGHAASVILVVALVGMLSLRLDLGTLRTLGATALAAFGVFKLLRPLSHPRWVGMRVTGRDLVAWSFLMSTAHGAGLMLVPVLLTDPAPGAGHLAHTVHAFPMDGAAAETVLRSAALGDACAVGLHTLAMFAAMALMALLVYEKLGLAVLRRAWVNVDRLWAGALIAAGWVALVW